MGWWERNFGGIKPEPPVIDHLLLNADGTPKAEPKAQAVGAGLSHAEKLALAAKRFGQPFKCAADDVPHVINRVDGTVTDTSTLVVDIDQAREQAEAEDAARRRAAPQPPNVTTISRSPR